MISKYHEEQLETSPPEELRRIQSERLGAVVRHVYDRNPVVRDDGDGRGGHTWYGLPGAPGHPRLGRPLRHRGDQTNSVGGVLERIHAGRLSSGA